MANDTANKEDLKNMASKENLKDMKNKKFNDIRNLFPHNLSPKQDDKENKTDLS